MLILNIRPGTWIQIGRDTFIQLHPSEKNNVKLAIDAPKSIDIARSDRKSQPSRLPDYVTTEPVPQC